MDKETKEIIKKERKEKKGRTRGDPVVILD